MEKKYKYKVTVTNGHGVFRVYRCNTLSKDSGMPSWVLEDVDTDEDIKHLIVPAAFTVVVAYKDDKDKKGLII